jgi:hypothetical protein
MSYPNISKGTGGRRRALAMAGGAFVAVAAVGLSTAVPAHASTGPTAELSFAQTTVSAGARPQMTFISSDVPAGAILYLEESADGGQHWKTVSKTTATQGTANLQALPEGVYEFEIVIADNNNTALGASAPATLTVTGPGGVQPTPPPAPPSPPAPAPSPAAAPSGSGISWLQMIVEPIWGAIVGKIISIIFSLF